MTRFQHPAAMAGPPIAWAEVERLLVVRPDNLGDVLLAGPVITALRAAVPRSRIDLLTSSAGAAAADLLPEIDGVLVARVSWQQIETTAEPPDDALVARVAERGYDAAVVLTSFSQSPWPAGYALQRARVPVRVGTSKEFGGTALTHWVPAPDDGLHQVDRALYLLARAGVGSPAGSEQCHTAATGSEECDIPAIPTPLHAHVPPAARERARVALAVAHLDPGAPYAVLLPGASCPSRRWPAERFRATAARLVEQGLPVVVCGPDAERELVTTVATSGAVALAGTLDVPGLAGLLAGAAVAVTNNSGGMHLADAVGTPVVALFAGTEDEGQYRPRSAPAAVLRVPTWCSPCRQFRCPFGLECLDVPVEQVVAAALRLAAGEPAAVRPSR